jgi:hypothetical protein
VRIHQKLRCTPALEAKVTDRLWSLEDMVGSWTNGKLTIKGKAIMAISQDNSWIVSKEGQRRVRVVKSSIGAFFYFEEEAYRFDEYVGDHYWSRSYISGLYDSARQRSKLPGPNFRGYAMKIQTDPLPLFERRPTQEPDEDLWDAMGTLAHKWKIKTDGLADTPSSAPHRQPPRCPSLLGVFNPRPSPTPRGGDPTTIARL